MRTSFSVLAVPVSLFLFSCGGSPAPQTANSGGATNASYVHKGNGPVEAKKVHDCAGKDHVHKYDLHDEDGDRAMVPCSNDSKGGHDFSGAIHLETIPEGVHITIHATDDEVSLGALGADVKTRDAVIVYPKGPGSKAVEIPLMHTAHGYTGDKVILYEDLEKLTDEGTTIHVAIYDHDKSTGKSAEELHVSLNVSAGKSCERAIDENPQTIDMGKKGSKADLTDSELGGPMRSSSFMGSCGLADSANAEICVALKQGKALGVSVKVSPTNNKVAACIDKATRRLKFPSSDKLDVVHQKF